jgi:hypothetical protein
MAKHSSSGRARIQDVAALAGVSPATASRALADDPKVTPATRQKNHGSGQSPEIPAKLFS